MDNKLKTKIRTQKKMKLEIQKMRQIFQNYIKTKNPN